MPTTLMTPDEVRKAIRQRTIERISIMRSRPKITLYDKNWRNPVPIMGEVTASFEEKLNDTGEGDLTLFGNHKVREWIIEELGDDEDLHIRVQMAGKEWTGKAVSITNRGDDKGFEYIDIKFQHEYQHCKRITCYSNPLLPHGATGAQDLGVRRTLDLRNQDPDFPEPAAPLRAALGTA